MHRVALVLLSMVAASLHAQSPTPALEHAGGGRFVSGDPLGVEVRGLARGDTATVRAYRRLLQSRQTNGASTVDTTHFTSWATVRGTGAPTLSLDGVAPIAGTWARPDARALLWSMEPLAPGASPRATPPRGEVRVVLEYRGRAVDSLSLQQVPSTGIAERTVVRPGVVGAWAAPADGARHPVVLLLHGSEGGDTTSAKAYARRFAARGFAAFAVVYVAYPYAGAFDGVPSTFTNIPVETIDRARAWAGAQPEADTARTALYGISKGAELALVAASRRAWPAAVVACVGSDVVWSGFGRAAAAGETLSSWSDGGAPLPAIPYDNYDDVFARTATARQVHDRSRTKSASLVPAATIDVARIRAPLLLFGGDDDEVWSSGSMTRGIVGTMQGAGLGARVEAETFPGAGHGICGDGTTPAAFFGAGPVPDPRASAAAAAVVFPRTLAFLRRHLSVRTR